MKNEFNDFRFAGLNYKEASNKYLTMKRVSDDENKIVVKVAGSNIVKTKFGYALILNYNHVVFLKNWQVDQNFFGIEVLLDREHFLVKKFGEFEDFDDDNQYLSFDEWVKVAKEQDNLTDEDGFKINQVKWTY